MVHLACFSPNLPVRKAYIAELPSKYATGVMT